MFHLLVYEEALGVNAANGDLDAVVDPEFTTRNDHFIFTENYNLLAAYYQAANATAARLSAPTINAIAHSHLFPFDRAATISTPSRIADFREMPMPLPMNEELAVEGSNNLGAATEDSTACLIIAPPSWNRNLPRGEALVWARATAAVAIVQRQWSLLGALTFEDNLRGGTYAVLGAYVQDAAVQAFRLNFSRMPLIQGRKLRPGFFGMEALGNVGSPIQASGLGEWGRFHTFEPPQIEIYSAAAGGASTQEVFLQLAYLGEGNLLG